MTDTDPAATYLRRHHPEHAELALWVRTVLLEVEPELSQRVYPGWRAVGFHHPETGYLCSLSPRPDALLLTFEHGAALPDPDGVLIGAGRQVRSLPVRDRDPATGDHIRHLLELAFVHRRRSTPLRARSPLAR